MIAGKFTQYTPDDEKLLNDAETIKKNTGLKVIFLCDREGRDWYEMQSNFDKNTIKIMYDDKGTIRSYSEDVSSLNPVDSFVAEVAPADFPSDIDIFGGWRFDGRKITRVPLDYLAMAEKEKSYRLQEAERITTEWRTELMLGIISDEDKASLVEWVGYIRALKALNLANITDEKGFNAIQWPEQPERKNPA